MRMWGRRTGDRGAILVQVGLSLLVLLAFSAFVVDYGVLWVSRGQAQNSADAAALAGAVALSYDDANDRTDSGAAKRNALNVALSHIVWGSAPTVAMSDITFPPCPDDGSNSCIRVNVSRSGLPTFFARLAGVDTQNVRATATAKAGYGNKVNCMAPFAVADKWFERNPDPSLSWTTSSTFDRWSVSGQTVSLLTSPDYYIGPGSAGFTGFRPFNPDMSYRVPDYGLQLTLKIGNNQNPQQMSSGWFQPLALCGTGGDEFREAVAGGCCLGFSINQTLTTEPGNMIGPTKQGVGDLVALDPSAYWDTTMNAPYGGVNTSHAGGSPRVVPVPLIDIQEYMGRAPEGRDTVVVTNIMGFFVEGMNGNDVVGRLCTIPGALVSGSPTLDNSYTFLRTIQLVR